MNILGLYLKADKAKTFTSVLAVFCLVAVSILTFNVSPISAEGDGAPVFNRFTPYTHYQVAGRDYFLLDVKNETKGTSWDSTTSADANDTLAFYLYYHNGVNNSVARNTRVAVNLSATPNASQTVSANLWADNATQVSGSSQVNISTSQRLEFIPGSLQWYPNQGTSSSLLPFAQSESQIFNSAGLNLGNIEGCWEFSGAVVFKTKVSNIQYTPTLSIDKKMRNTTQGGSWNDSLDNVAPQQTLGVQITITNSGTAEAKNVWVRDNLPASGQLVYVWGTTKLDGVSAFDIGSGFSIPSILPGQTKTLTFDVKVDQESRFNRGTTNLINTAIVTAQNFNDIQDTVPVNVVYTGCGSQNSNGMPASR